MARVARRLGLSTASSAAKFQKAFTHFSAFSPDMRRSRMVHGVRRNEPPLEAQRRLKMTKLRNMIGVAFVAMSLLTGFAVSAAHALDICQIDPAACDVVKEAP